MKRLAYPTGIVIILGLVMLATRPVDAQSGGSVKDIMSKLHKGENPPITAVKKGLQAEPPNWADVQKLTHDFAGLASSLSKNDPPKGDKSSWVSLTKAYADTAGELDKAAQKKDKGAALAAHGKLAAACANCHKTHRK